MSLKDVELQKFKEGFNQFSAMEMRNLFEYVKNLRYNSSAAAPLELNMGPDGMNLSLQQDVGNLVKAKAAIADGATGKVVLTDVLFNEIGDEFDAKNLSGGSVSNGDTKLMVGRDPSGSFFFRKTQGAVCEDGDCPDSCDNNTVCFEFFWAQGAATGSFFIETSCFRECIAFRDSIRDPECSGNVTDPTTSRVWTLNARWDLSGQEIQFTLSKCDGFNTSWFEGEEPIFVGGTCPNGISITSVEDSPGACIGTSTFPCCDSSEGCSCL